MSRTLRHQRSYSLMSEAQTHSAALRATRYLGRHAWQFHGAGVGEAMRPQKNWKYPR